MEKFKHKHHESRFTRFYEDFWLARKFGYEKRRAHFSSLILTGQMKRDDAIKRISRPELDEITLMQEYEFVANKLDISKNKLDEFFNGENKTYLDYPNNWKMISFASQVMQKLGLDRRLLR